MESNVNAQQESKESYSVGLLLLAQTGPKGKAPVCPSVPCTQLGLTASVLLTLEELQLLQSPATGD